MRERYKGIVVLDKVYQWLPDYLVDLPGPYRIPLGSEVSCLLCWKCIITSVVLTVLEKSMGSYQRIGMLNNDPFVSVPAKALMEKATK
jgi:hypothetical protein